MKKNRRKQWRSIIQIKKRMSGGKWKTSRGWPSRKSLLKPGMAPSAWILTILPSTLSSLTNSTRGRLWTGSGIWSPKKLAEDGVIVHGVKTILFVAKRQLKNARMQRKEMAGLLLWVWIFQTTTGEPLPECVIRPVVGHAGKKCHLQSFNGLSRPLPDLDCHRLKLNGYIPFIGGRFSSQPSSPTALFTLSATTSLRSPAKLAPHYIMTRWW